jgi:hypothetical protein
MEEERVMQLQPQTSPWAPWLAWILGNTAGAAIGVAVATTIILLIGADEHGIASFVLAPAIAACMVMAQWLVIRQYLPRAIWWILASVVGVFLGAAVIGVVAWIAEATLGGTTMRGAEALVVPCSLYGASIGFAQWLCLRRHASHAGWWILASALGAAVLGAVMGGSIGNTADLVWIGAVPAAITGIALEALIRQPIVANFSMA